MAIVAMMMVACSNEENAVDNGQGKVMTLTTTIKMADNASTRTLTDIGTQITAEWAVGDKFALCYQQNTPENISKPLEMHGLGMAEAISVSGGIATVQATLTDALDGGNMILVYPYAHYNTPGTVHTTDQVGTLADINEKFACMSSGYGTMSVSGNTVSINGGVTMTQQICIWKFTFTDGVNDITSSITNLKLAFASLGGVVYDINPTSQNAIYVAINGAFPYTTGAVTITATTASGKFTASKPSVTLQVGQMYESNVALTHIDGLLTGKFSVSATKKVQFSKGNLQYTKKGTTWDNTGTWSFMEKQWDTVEYQGSDPTADYANKDVVSLFCWGTAGHSFASGYGTAYQPWATIENTSTTNYYGPTDGTSGLTGTYAQGDWGTNAISNGGNTANSGWRTLSKDEWEWLLGPYPDTSTTPNPGTNCRTSSTIGSTANARWVKATVHSKKGLIIFPDEINWDATTMGDAPTNINIQGGSFSSYSLTDVKWSALESAGCVFLPAAGNRAVLFVHNNPVHGTYWSTTRDSPGGALRVYFSDDEVKPYNVDATCTGKSVRLVYDAN